MLERNQITIEPEPIIKSNVNKIVVAGISGVLLGLSIGASKMGLPIAACAEAPIIIFGACVYLGVGETKK